MGQAFACFVSVHNDSNDIVTNVVVKVLMASVDSESQALYQHLCQRLSFKAVLNGQP
jgi:hypothetical protein